jgi:hypothetical protein
MKRRLWRFLIVALFGCTVPDDPERARWQHIRSDGVVLMDGTPCAVVYLQWKGTHSTAHKSQIICNGKVTP